MKHVNIRSVKQGTGELVELYLEAGLTGGRLLCPENLIPQAGQYLLAHDPASDSPLPVPVFNAGFAPGGFLIAPSIPQKWQPGTSLSLRGPLGRGFSLPAFARSVALVPLGETSARLKPLLAAALEQSASVVLVTDLDLSGLPPEAEVQPVSMLAEIARWADYMAFDVNREFLPGMGEILRLCKQAGVKAEAQVLVLTPMPCGSLAECGVCAVSVRHGWKMACKDGPVFDFKELTAGVMI
jgi:Iron-sulfur cluster binding domain of dihydroorotate dehydrogenase B